MKLSLVSLLVLWASVVAATTAGDALFRACVAQTAKYKFECDSKYAKLKGRRVTGCGCWSNEYLATYYDCAVRAPNGNVEKALNSLFQACHAAPINRTLTTDLMKSVYKNATDFFIPVANIKNKTETLYNPIKFTNKQIQTVSRSWGSGFYAKYTGQLYGGIMAGYFAFIVVCGAFFNFLKKVAPRFVEKVTNNKFSLVFRKKIANPALFGFKHSTPAKFGPFGFINMSLPTRAQTWILAGYFAMFIVFNFIKYDFFAESTKYATITLQASRAVGDRTGIMACTQLPLIYLFAGRNNFMLYITGWSYDTFNVYHRAVARVMYICIFIHAVAFTIHYHLFGTLAAQYAQAYVRWGVVAVVSCAMILFFALRFFRERFYEFFVQFHRIFVIIFTVSTWYHLKPHGYMEWLYASIAVWAFDRLARVVRIVVSGVTAKAELQTFGHEFVKLKVKYSGVWKPSPGAYAFIHFLRPFYRSWEDHPFSCYPSPIPGEEKNTMVFCMRILGGKTKHIADYLSTKQEGKDTVPVFIDGPYGQHFPLETSDSIIFIAGGIGFTGAYAYACKYKELGGSKRIVFIWVTRYTHNIEVFKDELNVLAHEDNVDVQIYISDEQGPIGVNAGIDAEKNAGLYYSLTEKTSFNSKSISSHSVSYGLPNLKEMVPGYITESIGSTAFMCCGPPGMNDHVRATVIDNMDKGKGRVDLYVEAFTW